MSTHSRTSERGGEVAPGRTKRNNAAGVGIALAKR